MSSLPVAVVFKPTFVWTTLTPNPTYAYSIVLMGYLLRLIPILTTFALFDVRPNKHASEMFAGERQWSGNMLELGYVVQSFDSTHNLCHDFLTPTGFLVAIVTVMTICLNGILWLAPP